MNNFFFINILKRFPNTSISSQMHKINEEFKEIEKAIINNDTDNLIEECYDTIQAILSLVEVMGAKDEFKAGAITHKTKMMSRGYDIEEL